MINLSGGTMAVEKALQEYQTAWKAFLVVHHLEQLEQLAKATTLSWKVATKTDLFANLQSVAAQTEQVHIGTVNDRFIASILLHEPLENQLSILKILERRPASSDALGLDSIDYLVEDMEQVYQLLKAADAQVEKQHNDIHEWLSLRFGSESEFEAKFTDHLVVEVAIKELQLGAERLKND